MRKNLKVATKEKSALKINRRDFITFSALGAGSLLTFNALATTGILTNTFSQKPTPYIWAL